ncbi:SDR family oxidoreductase [Cellulomonas sp. zg-ZUI199]|uniref:SDR family oxidoreductase n=1 Tax=Cellulomonas wangleii TaxID=2816956 RepID=A0ABX8D4S5_9CELL|nr:SDR family oxidoreductase [Cellulomonas wangleii]MBO0923732.1 SDR family oxidoreductase [Cellulomonas wangleii]MBO0924014.1 SDR family oxidoreductase [Cellulomonas wangleii]QVI62043.1 SDR family oxidoreductase [Cellulomonas wangleii]
MADQTTPQDPTTQHPDPDTQTAEQIEHPGRTEDMRKEPDHGEESYRGSGRLEGRRALITGGDSGIGRAVAIAFAREGADVAISYLPEEEEDARVTLSWIEKAGRKGLLLPGDIRDEALARSLPDRAAQELGGLDVLVNNAAYQMAQSGLADITTEQLDRVLKTNIYAMFWITQAALPHLGAGASIINTSSIQAFDPSPGLLDYASTKAAIYNFTMGLAQQLAEDGIRVNAVCPGPIWTPLIPATMNAEKVESFGSDTPLGRAGQPAELAPAYVFLASQESSYVTGDRILVTGGRS